MLIKRGLLPAVLLGIFALICNVIAKTDDILSRLLASDRKPMVVYIKPDQPPKHYHDHDDKGPMKLQTYWFDYLIRATEDVSAEDYKDALRTNIGRCRPVHSCEKKCPPKKYECIQVCKEVFDKYDDCDPPEDPCTKLGKCGKTLPPYWRSLDSSTVGH